VAAVNFTVFGFSDFVEAATGAWWRPWPLALWKGTCVAVMFVQLMLYTAQHRGQVEKRSGEPAGNEDSAAC